MQQSSRFHLHIPYINNKEVQEGNQQDFTVIGLIDASGSMEISWEWLVNFWNKSMPLKNLITITFSNTAQKVHNNKLSIDIMQHGGKSTEIVPAFELLEKEINNIPLKNNITIIFISDGQDNNVKTIEQRINQKLKGNTQNRNINFVCLGIGDEFPTFLSMNLRKLYHQGDPQIPTLYLIEHPSEQAFFNKFESMKQYFQPQKILKLNQIVQLYPFDEEVTDTVYEGQWVFTKKKDISLIEFPDVQISSINEKDLEIDDAINLFRFWVQGIQLKVINKEENAQVKASVCYQMAKNITDNLSQVLQINVLQDNLKSQIDYNQHSFKQRAIQNYVANYGNKIIFYVNELKRLSEGVDFKEVNEFEAAKRLNIGTIVGKYQQKALALKGITVQEFKQIRNEFSLLIQNSKIQHENEQGQERSVISLENQRDIISQKDDILEGLNYIKTQFDFVEAFPLIGHSITVKRSEGSQINPWLISVTKFAKIHKIIDSGLLIKNNFNVQINIGNQQQEDINCLLPLFNKSDADMKQFIRSRMIKLLMTYLVQQNIEMFYEETYLALLSNALIYLLKQEKSEWQQQILENIFETTKLAYEGTQQFEQYLDKFLNNPNQALFEKEAEYERFVSTSKPFIYLFYIMMKKDIVVDFEKEIEKLILHYFRVQMVEYKHNLNYFIRIVLKGQEQLDEQFQQEIFKLQQNCEYFAKFSRELEKLANKRFKQVMKQNDNILCSIEIINDRVYNDVVKLSLKVIENFYFLFTGKQFDKVRYLHLIYHVFTINQNEMFNTSVNYDNLEEIKNEIFQGKQIELPQIFQNYIEQLEKQYLKTFAETHMMIKPINFNILKEECVSRNINFQNIKFNYQSRLSSNCCLAPQCPFYLSTNIDFSKHMQNWKEQMPFGFHKFVLEQIEQGNDIKKIMQECKKKWHQFPENYNQDDEVVEKYIKMISESI